MKRRAIRLIVALAVLFGFLVTASASPMLGLHDGIAPVSAAGMDRYVANGGSDTTGDGTQSNPWQTIQYAVDHSDAGDIINVAAGTYTGAILAKDVAVVGADGGGSIIATGVAYAVGSGLKTGFRLDGTADGAEIRNFTVNCNSAANFYFGVFARGADSVVLDALTINDPVQGITNRGGSNWTITDNQVTNVKTIGGGGIGICLTVRSPEPLACSGNYVDNNTITLAATAPDYTCPGIILWLDLRGSSGVPAGAEDLSGNQIVNNSISGTSAMNQAGIEVGVGGLNGDPAKISATLGMIHDNTISSNTIDAVYYGMYVYTATNLEVTGNDISGSTNTGVYLSEGISGGGFSGNDICGNACGILNETGVLVNAENNWWGDNSGPYNAASNPSGTGNAVSDDVDFTPWTGMITPPDTPSNVSPLDGAICVNLGAPLQSSTFSDPGDGDTHAASQWQVSTESGAYSSPVFDSGADASHLTGITVPAGLLSCSTVHYWHVRHQDNHGAWSDWSTETSFTTRPPNGWYEQYTAANARSGVINTFWLSQSFIPATSHNLNTLSFNLQKVGSPAYTVTVGLYLAGADNKPIGTALSTTTFQASSVSTSADWYEYQISPCQVTAGTGYALVLSATEGAAGNCVYWRVNTAGRYARGMRATSNDQGATWTAQSALDFMFREGQNPPVWYEQYAASNARSGVINTFWLSQSFAPVTSHTLNTVSLCVHRVGSPNYTVTIALYSAGADNKPAGPPLCTTTFESNTLTTTPAWCTYQFSTGHDVTAGTRYALVLSATEGDLSNMVYWRVNTAGTYARGMRSISSDQGTTWTTQSALDFMFREGRCQED